jgi:hypothetical protein
VTLAQGGMAVTFPDWEALRVAKTILIMAGYSPESENGDLQEILCHPGALRVARNPEPELERLRRPRAPAQGRGGTGRIRMQHG